MKLTKNDIQELADANGIPAALLEAICNVEAPKGGHLADGRPAILFEGHKFYEFLPPAQARALAVKYPDICYRYWTKAHYKGGAGEHERLGRAAAIDRTAALKAASWGRPQILGANFRAAGFQTLQAFINCMYGPERGHIQAMVAFLRSSRAQYDALMAIPHYRGATPAERKADLLARCVAFVRRYNGPRYAENDYHTKFAREYARLTGVKEFKF